MDLPGPLSTRTPVFVSPEDVVLFHPLKGAQLFDLGTGRRTPLQGHSREVTHAVASDHRFLTYGLDRTVRRWDLSGVEGQTLARHGARIWAGALDRLAGRLATTGFDGTTLVLDLTGKSPPLRLQSHLDPRVYHSVFSPDGRWLATGSADETAHIWNLDVPNAPPRVIPGHTGWAYALAFSPDSRLLATGDKVGVVRVAAVDGAEPARVVGRHVGEDQPLRIHHVTFTAEGTAVASAAKSGSVVIWSLDGGAPRELPGHDLHAAVTATPGGDLMTLSAEGSVRTWSSAGVLKATYGADRAPTAWATAGGRLAVAYADGSVRAWELTQPSRPIMVIPATDHVYEAMRFDATADRLVLGDNSGRLVIYEVPGARPTWTFSGYSGPVRFVAFSGADALISASADGTVRRWETPSDAKGKKALLRSRIRDCLTVTDRRKWLGETAAAAASQREACLSARAD